MAGRYAKEMESLRNTLAWVAAADLDAVRYAVRTASTSPLRAVGSGGSLTAAHALAALHRRYAGHLAAVATPLEAINDPLNIEVSTWLLTAGGSNVDILSAAKFLIQSEPRQLAVLCGRSNSPLVNLCREYSFIDLMLYALPTGKDGFLATNSLLGFATILARAYASEFGRDDDWHEAHEKLLPILQRDSPQIEAWHTATQPLWARSTTLVLHGASTHIGAVDLESKFTESALGNVQTADYRNFAHGRHHWLAKRGGTSAILALLTDDDRAVAQSTLELVPTDIPRAQVYLGGGPTASALASLAVAFWITDWAGHARSVDPGRPGVPAFGRKIYRLRVRRRRSTATRRLSPRLTAAITRKARLISSPHGPPTALKFWLEVLETFLERLRNRHFGAVVLDYDGTIVDARHRFAPPTLEICSELTRLAESGVPIGIATGRGKSVRKDLQTRLPQALWPHMLIGYYNGAEVASLDDESAPDASLQVVPSLAPFVDLLRSHPALSSIAHQTDRPLQITLQLTRPMPKHLLWELVNEVVQPTSPQSVTIVRSGHSVDVLAAGVSKLNVLRRLRETVGDEPILTIGDRGRWPGNDYELLSESYALSVDEVSTDASSCWHLGRPGQRGPAVTLEYLSALSASRGHLTFTAGAFK